MLEQEIPIIDGNTVDKSKYWQVRTNAIEWRYVLFQLAASIGETPDVTSYMTQFSRDGSVTYMLRKDLFPPAVMMKATGMAQEKLEEAPVIRLNGPKDTGLPEPTVQGWGTA